MENFCYLIDAIKAIIWREFDSVATKIRIRQCKFREEVSFLVCRILPLKAKGRLYSPCVRSIMIYGSETWPVKEGDAVRLDRNHAKMVRWYEDRISAEELRARLKLKSLQ